mmetsp:Transcript_1667/g.5923  ORF Transcript_1667/g.5923 Transcript_1667/m.5923 type:complete len:215 (+) Transcript_1667:461-1105(+)
MARRDLCAAEAAGRRRRAAAARQQHAAPRARAGAWRRRQARIRAARQGAQQLLGRAREPAGVPGARAAQHGPRAALFLGSPAQRGRPPLRRQGPPRALRRLPREGAGGRFPRVVLHPRRPLARAQQLLGLARQPARVPGGARAQEGRHPPRGLEGSDDGGAAGGGRVQPAAAPRLPAPGRRGPLSRVWGRRRGAPAQAGGQGALGGPCRAEGPP